MIPLLLPSMMKAYPLEESYLLPEDLFCQPMLYVTVSLILFFFNTCLIDHTSHYMTDCCVIVCVSFYSEEPLQLKNISPAVLQCLRVLQFL